MLEIAASFDEYDVNSIPPGMMLVTLAYGTRDAFSDGTFTLVTLASTKDAAGQSGGDVGGLQRAPRQRARRLQHGTARGLRGRDEPALGQQAQQGLEPDRVVAQPRNGGQRFARGGRAGRVPGRHAMG